MRETILEVTAAAQAAALWTALNLVLMLTLSLLVVRLRRAHKVASGDGGFADLARAIRAFGNAAEYVPAGLAALAVLALAGAPAAAVHLAGLLLVLGRLLHAIGLSRNEGASLLRSAGMVLTWVAYILAAVALAVCAFP